MTASKKLDFTSPARVGLSVDEEEDHSDVTPLTRKTTSQRKRPASSNEQEEPKKKKKKKSSSSSSLAKIWNENDELIILKGLVDFRAKEGNDTKLDWDGFYSFIKDLIQVQVSKRKVFTKITELKNKFLNSTSERVNNGIDTEPEAFKLSILLWGTNDDDDKNVEDEEDDVATEPVNENEAAKTNADDADKSVEGNANAEHVTDNEATKTDIDEEPRLELPVHNENKSGEEKLHDNVPADNNFDEGALQVLVEKITENKPFGKMSHDDEAGTSKTDGKLPQQIVVGELVQQTVVDINTENTTTVEEESRDDDLCTLQEAIDTTISQGLPKYQKKFQGKKLMNLETQKRKELSDEWKEICSEKTRFSVKKSRFSAKLVEAASDG